MSLPAHTVQRLIELVEEGAQHQGAWVEMVLMADDNPLMFYEQLLKKYEPHNRILIPRGAQACVLPFEIKTLDRKCVAELTVMIISKNPKVDSFDKSIRSQLSAWEKAHNKSSNAPF